MDIIVWGLGAGVLQLVAGLRNLHKSERALAAVALVVGLPTGLMNTWGSFGFLMGAFGLAVLFRREVLAILQPARPAAGPDENTSDSPDVAKPAPVAPRVAPSSQERVVTPPQTVPAQVQARQVILPRIPSSGTAMPSRTVPAQTQARQVILPRIPSRGTATRSEQRRRFSLARYGLHVVIAMSLVTLWWFVYWFLLPEKTVTVERFDEMGGQLLGVNFCTAILTLGPSYLVQNGFRKIGLALLIPPIGLMAWSVASVYMATHSRAPGSVVAGQSRARSVPQDSQHPVPLAADEAVPLETVELQGVRRLRHPKLGFSLLHPGTDFFDAQVAALEIDRRFSAASHGRDWTKSYIYVKKVGGTALSITIANGIGGTEQQLRELSSLAEVGVATQERTRLGPDVKIEHLQDEVVWDANRHEARRHFVVGDMHYRLRAHALQPGGHPPFVVVLILLSREPTELDEVLDSFRPPTDGTAQLQ